MSGRRMTTEERARWRIRDDQCAVVLSSRLPEDSACLLPLPCSKHGPAPTPMLTDFLLARIAEDAALADRSVQLQLRAGAGLVSFGAPGSPLILIHTPARILAEVEAKRRIVGQLASAKEWMDAQPLSEKVRSDPTPPHAYYMATREAVKALAAVYSDHPDFREEWRP